MRASPALATQLGCAALTEILFRTAAAKSFD